MPGYLEEYRGFTIIWDVASVSNTLFRTVTASLVFPPHACGISNVQSVPLIPDGFGSDTEARESVLRAARKLIDNRIPSLAMFYDMGKAYEGSSP
jgi:hypothetical protein